MESCMATGNPIGSPLQPYPRVGSPTPPHDCPLTNIDETERLWTCVRSATKTMSTRGSAAKASGRARHEAAPGSAASDGGPSSNPRSLFDPSESKSTPGSTLTMTARGVSPRSPRFSQLVLEPRSIYINATNSIVASAFAHFGTEEPLHGNLPSYGEMEPLRARDIWVTMSPDEIASTAEEYRVMRGLGLCEEEFADMAKRVFFRRGQRWLAEDEMDEDKLWRGKRMLQLVSPPKESAHWHMPPIVEAGAAQVDWSWDVRPDCAYWLSLSGFNPQYHFQIQNCAFVKDFITCPYLTIEFKRDGESDDPAVRQLAAAGSLALYNRYRLRLEALARTKATSRKMSDLRHYTLSFVGHKFVVWVIMPTLDEAGQWKGCTMRRLIGAECTDKYGVQELVAWVNEIHRWGLSEHSRGCERDIKIILNVGGVRTSDIGSPDKA